MKRGWLLRSVILLGVAGWSADNGGRHLALRSRVELFRGSDQWKEVRVDYPFNPAKSALIVCDMWDRHWCNGANVRVAALVKKLEPVLEIARRKGMIIVHAPSETMSFYANTPQRQRMLSLLAVAPPKEINITSPPLPIDDWDGGCDTAGEKEH
jgi:hypothetical protein